MKVKDVMSGNVTTIGPEDSLKEAAALLSDRPLRELPVVDVDGSLVGVVSETDILLKEGAAAPGGGLRGLLHRDEARALQAKVEARTVRDAMTSPPVTVESWMTLTAAAELMLRHGVSRLPVIDHGELVGIIGRDDLVRAFARSDEEIERDIRQEAFGTVPCLGELELSVCDGEVILRGELDSSFDAETLPHRIRRVPGVVSVDSALRTRDPVSHERVVVAVHRD